MFAGVDSECQICAMVLNNYRSAVESKPRNWLSEADVEFFTGGAPSEVLSNGIEATSGGEAGEVRRRLLIGLALTLGAGIFALVPTERLQPPPSKPLFLYLVPLLRVKELLREAQQIIADGNYDQLRAVLSRIEGPPNNVQENLRSAAACELSAEIRTFKELLRVLNPVHVPMHCQCSFA